MSKMIPDKYYFSLCNLSSLVNSFKTKLFRDKKLAKTFYKISKENNKEFWDDDLNSPFNVNDLITDIELDDTVNYEMCQLVNIICKRMLNRDSLEVLGCLLIKFKELIYNDTIENKNSRRQGSALFLFFNI